jgi:DNA-binding NarL/FixJ family response regulator
MSKCGSAASTVSREAPHSRRLFISSEAGNKSPSSWVFFTLGGSHGQLVAALKAGASGYLVKDIGPAALRESLALVLMGEKVLPSELVPSLISAPARPGRSTLPRLSAQEERILEYLARGEPNKEIAAHLSVTESMVKVHMKALLRKIGAPNRTIAAIWALNNLGSANP